MDRCTHLGHMPSIFSLEAIVPANGQCVAPWQTSRKEGNNKQRFSEFNALLKLVQDCAMCARMPDMQAAAILDQSYGPCIP